MTVLVNVSRTAVKEEFGAETGLLKLYERLPCLNLRASKRLSDSVDKFVRPEIRGSDYSGNEAPATLKFEIPNDTEKDSGYATQTLTAING